MPSFEAVRPSHTHGYLLQSSHAEGFFSEEERNRRRKVLERIPALGGRNEAGLSLVGNSDNVGSENDRDAR